MVLICHRPGCSMRRLPTYKECRQSARGRQPLSRRHASQPGRFSAKPRGEIDLGRYGAGWHGPDELTVLFRQPSLPHYRKLALASLHKGHQIGLLLVREIELFDLRVQLRVGMAPLVIPLDDFV